VNVTQGNNTMNFRQATTDDITAMSAIRLSVKENALSDPGRITWQMYHDYLDLLGRGWVAEIDGSVVGFCYACKGNSSIWALFVSPQHERKGIAKRLLALAVDWLFGQGNGSVELTTSVATRAEEFYLRQGWTRTVLNEREAGFKLKGGRAAAE
jgi:GNAT superfamily N-acetyltransferase